MKQIALIDWEKKCSKCKIINRGLGHFQDSIEFLKKAISYLEFHTVDGTQKGGRRP